MKGVRTKTVFSDHGVTVTAVESVVLQAGRSNQRHFAIGSLRPMAVIVSEPGRRYALDMASQPVDIERLELPADFDLD